jgi:hypothetical protein
MLLRHRSSEDRNQGLSTIPCEDAKGEERVCKYSVGETCLTPNLFQVWGTLPDPTYPFIVTQMA